MNKHTPRVLVALALLGGMPAAAFADGIVPSVGKAVGGVVEGTGEALFGTDKDTTVVVEDRNPDVVVRETRPAVVVAEPAPVVAVPVQRRPVVVEKSAEPDVEVNVNN